MKIYKIHDSMRLAIAAIRDKLQTLMDTDEEFGILDSTSRKKYAALLDQAESMSFAAMYQETDGKTLKRISNFVNEHAAIGEASIWSLA